MKLTNVVVNALNASPILFSFRDPQALNPYNVKSILGLDADILIPKYSGVTSVSKLYNLALNKRDVVLQVGLNPDYADDQTYSQLRDELYKLISTARTGLVQLQFKNEDVIVAAIAGFISKIEADLFQQDLEIQITLTCKDSMLKTIDPVSIPTATSDPTILAIQDDKSTAQHGFQFVAEFTAPTSAFTIIKADIGYSFTVRPRGGFLDGDHLHFSSEFDNRFVFLNRGAGGIHLADVVDLRSIWPLIFPGANTFQIVPGTTSFFNEITHHETYWGV